MKIKMWCPKCFLTFMAVMDNTKKVYCCGAGTKNLGFGKKLIRVDSHEPHVMYPYDERRAHRGQKND